MTLPKIWSTRPLTLDNLPESSLPHAANMPDTTQLPLHNFLVHSIPKHPRSPPTKRPPSPTPEKRTKRPKRRNKRPACTLSNTIAPPLRGSDLPGEFSAVTDVTDVQLTPLHLGELKGSRKRNRSYGSVRRFLVHWAPEICPYMEVQKQRRAGFRTLSLEILPQVHDPELDAEDTKDPCHGCGEGAGDQYTGPPLFHCERCAKWWHAHCLPDSPSPETIVNSPVWTCPQCLPASPSHPVPLQLCRVQWAPDWQGEKHIRSLIGGREALLRFHQSRLPTTHAPSPPSPPPRRPPARHIAGKRRRMKPHTRSPPP